MGLSSYPLEAAELHAEVPHVARLCEQPHHADLLLIVSATLREVGQKFTQHRYVLR